MRDQLRRGKTVTQKISRELEIARSLLNKLSLEKERVSAELASERDLFARRELELARALVSEEFSHRLCLDANEYVSKLSSAQQTIESLQAELS